jgi:peptide deformylase
MYSIIMVTIVQSSDKILRQIAQEVPISEITSPKIQKIISDMKEAMGSQKDGVAIAAPQIGHGLRIVVVSDKILKEADVTYKSIGKDLVFINPKITKLSRDKHDVEEGCLSVRWKYGKVKRSVKTSIEGYNELGELVKRGASGLLAQVFQHECDHLDGILFTDTAYDVEDVPPEELTNNEKN